MNDYRPRPSGFRPSGPPPPGWRPTPPPHNYPPRPVPVNQAYRPLNGIPPGFRPGPPPAWYRPQMAQVVASTGPSGYAPRPTGPHPGVMTGPGLTDPTMSSEDLWNDGGSDSSGTFVEDTPEAKAGPASSSSAVIARPLSKKNPNVPVKSYALLEDKGIRTNLGNTKVVMGLLSEMWLFSLCFILGGTYLMTFQLPQFYVDDQLWNYSCYWKIFWILPIPYTLICFFGMVLPFRTPKFLYNDSMPKRRIDNLYILTVTKGDNREAVYRSWNAHKHLERLHPCIRVNVLTDEPYFFEGINCYTCPRNFTTGNSKYKARALEWYRQTMRYTEHDWVLHLDEESVIDDDSVRRILEFIWYEHDYHWGQGVILYNQYRYWSNWIFTVADAIRVGDDISRFQLQYSYFHRPVFGAHGSFLLSNGAVENAVTWDLGSLTEDYQFAMHAWDLGYRCGKIPGLVREQSPMDFIGFMKQRRRWYVGIRRLPNLLPKIWAFFWSLGTLSLFGTIVSIPLGFFVPLGTPRWFGLLKDFSFVNFVYLYLTGIFIQDLDNRKNPLLILLHIPMTFIIQFIAAIMEGLAVMYGVIFPPTDFDVIKK